MPDVIELDDPKAALDLFLRGYSVHLGALREAVRALRDENARMVEQFADLEEEVSKTKAAVAEAHQLVNRLIAGEEEGMA